MTAWSFAKRLRDLAGLSGGEIEAIRAMPWSTVTVRRARDILSLGDRPDYLYVIEDGWGARYGVRSDGSRRITGFMLPGDLCGIHAITDEAMDHAIVALTDCRVARVGNGAIADAVASSPAIAQALWRAKLADEATLRTWLLNSHDAAEALAHLICELHARADAIGLVHDRRFRAPLTQEHIGDALGFTSVHVNRMVKLLRTSGLTEVASGEVIVPDVEALRRFCGFSPAYLHLPAAATRLSSGAEGGASLTMATSDRPH